MDRRGCGPSAKARIPGVRVLACLLLTAQALRPLTLESPEDSDFLHLADEQQVEPVDASSFIHISEITNVHRRGIGMEQQDMQGSSKPDCLQAPSCLEPQGTCLTATHVVRTHLPECKKLPDYCTRSVYTLPSSKLRMTLPIFTMRNLSNFYQKVYDGQCMAKFCIQTRPQQQSEIIRKALPEAVSGLKVTEIGCASGALLKHLQPLAARGGKLECYEPDPKFNGANGTLQKMLRSAEKANEGLTWEVHPNLLDFADVAENSIDVFASSHVVEHMTDPCPYLAGLYKALKPGGVVFTEVPHQYEDPAKQITRGMLHLLYFNQDTFQSMMEIGGFTKVYANDDGTYIRSVYRKPQ
mmetsp:Transcript_58986/g.140843  ORF Transcript_58986/g.140843 Transcript_58986/m.140843 type:complete len:354 (-) Transcript_58986:72-1133(-)